ncbi:hypothetical protein [uncultured Shewanella sp.]|uniref:hypothetical protein n=1 Tax=uncultured Shewanella sp. TaxID=173975 RepID=UPI0026353A7B|nr:hypothetical protein [uncultured Shewanella sp.]
MSNIISQAVFSITEFRAGASSLTAQVTENDRIHGYRLLVENVSGGSATALAQYWQDNTPLGQPVELNITESTPLGNSISTPASATKVVITFGNITFPMGTVIITISTE